VGGLRRTPHPGVADGDAVEVEVEVEVEVGAGAGDGDSDGDGDDDDDVPRGAPRRTDRMFRPSRKRLAHHRVGPQRVSARLGPYKQPMGPFADRDASENRTVGGRHRVHL
jgi:hypothetical protein